MCNRYTDMNYLMDLYDYYLLTFKNYIKKQYIKTFN